MPRSPRSRRPRTGTTVTALGLAVGAAIACGGDSSPSPAAAPPGGDAGADGPVAEGACPAPTADLTVATFDGLTTDVARARDIRYRVRYAPGWGGCAPVIFVSHGGNGAEDGQLALGHLGDEYAAHGYLAVHVNHRPSAGDVAHQRDRPADVSFLLDQLVADRLALPADLRAAVDPSRVGHAGHSWGAYTAHALGGGTFTSGTFRDARILAIVPLSPQGPDQLGAFDRGPDDNSWRTVAVPAYSFVGGVEKDSSFGEDPPTTMPDWRLFPFLRYPASPDKYLAVIPGQDHVAMGGAATPDVNAYVVTQSRAFFDVYVRGDAREVCALGPGVPGALAPAGTDTRHKTRDGSARASAACP